MHILRTLLHESVTIQAKLAVKIEGEKEIKMKNAESFSECSNTK